MTNLTSAHVYSAEGGLELKPERAHLVALPPFEPLAEGGPKSHVFSNADIWRDYTLYRNCIVAKPANTSSHDLKEFSRIMKVKWEDMRDLSFVLLRFETENEAVKKLKALKKHKDIVYAELRINGTMEDATGDEPILLSE